MNNVRKPHKRGRRMVRTVAAALSIVLLTALPTGLLPAKVEAATSSQLQSQLNQLKNEEQKLKQQIKELGSSLSNAQARKTTLEKQVTNTRAQIEALTDQISQLNAGIAAKNAEIAKKEEDVTGKEAAIADRFEQLRQRLRAISKSGNMSKLQMLFSTKDYADYLVKARIMESVAESDQQLMDELETEKQAIRAEQQSLETEKAAIAEEKKNVETLKKTADSKKAELDKLYAQINAETKKLASSLAQQQKELKEAQAEEAKIQQLLNQSNYTGKYGGGTMTWPVPAVKNLSSTYGWRWGKLHKGVDIANGSVKIYGQNIVAAADGEVIRAFTANTWGGGYGYHVVIDHGKNAKGVKISTLYAHCSRVSVRVGQIVKAGQVIAQAGDTGNVTGPHLHFEVWENGVAVDPILKGYLKKN